MKTLQGYRYLFGVRPGPDQYALFRRIGATLGQSIRLDLLHLTFCVVAESRERVPFIPRRIRIALGDAPLHSFPVNLSRVVTGPRGACARTFGAQDEIQDFYRGLVRALRSRGIEPLHRRSGLHPHVTLGHASLPPGLLEIAIRWFPTHLLLIESEVGLTRHNVLERWPLLAPRQPSLPLGEGPIAAAGRAPRSAA